MSNVFGGNTAHGRNYAHRNATYRDPRKFRNAILPAGALSFLLCAGDMRGALHDNKTCGGVAHFPLFHPSCDFSALYEAIECPDDLNGNGTADIYEPEVEEPVNTLWTLFSKLSPDDGAHAEYAGSIAVGSVASPTVHPAGVEIGQSINGWNVFTVCALTQPADDSNNHYWIAGSPDDYTLAAFTRTSPDSIC